ncbi:MAG: hypothetical protein AB2794_16835 [Candidatus Thiodiazotropha endolucinida]
MHNHQHPLIDSNDALDREDTIEMLRLSAEYTSTLLAIAMSYEKDVKPSSRLVEEINYMIGEQLRIAKRLAGRDNPSQEALHTVAPGQANAWVRPICSWRMSECKGG